MELGSDRSSPFRGIPLSYYTHRRIYIYLKMLSVLGFFLLSSFFFFEPHQRFVTDEPPCAPLPTGKVIDVDFRACCAATPGPYTLPSQHDNIKHNKSHLTYPIASSINLLRTRLAKRNVPGRQRQRKRSSLFCCTRMQTPSFWHGL